MAQNRVVLKIYCLSQPLLTTECLSILGDKYGHALPFDFVLAEKIEDASVIIWDGIISLKQKRILPEIEKNLGQGKMLLLLGEAQTLYTDHPLVKIFKANEENTIHLSGWSVLPEEILAALETCYKKVAHV